MSEAIMPLPVTPEEEWLPETFFVYHQALRGERTWYDGSIGEYRNIFVEWFQTLTSNFDFHPSVKHMVEKYRPADFKKLAMEAAHISTTDELRIAYTRSAADAQIGRKLVTSIGKYLARHWPHVPDHLRRDAQALYSVDERLLVDTMPHIIRTVELGPRSCMASAHGSIPWRAQDTLQMEKYLLNGMENEPSWEKHPYISYAPELGWSMAQRWSTAGGQGRRLDGRALIYKGPAYTGDATGVFVRTYARNKQNPVDGYSETDFALQTWLEKQGYIKVGHWPDGALLRTREIRPGCIFLPYVDGEAVVELMPEEPGAKYRMAKFVPEMHSGLFNPKSTSGHIGEEGDDDDEDDDDDDNEYHFYCEDCDDRYHEDEKCWVGREEDRCVCTGCRDDHYRWVRAAPRSHDRGSDYIEYYTREDGVQHVYRPARNASFEFDDGYAPDCVVQLENGDFAHEDDVISIDDEYYLECQTEYVTLEDGEHALSGDACLIGDEWCLKDECYESDEQSGHWFKEEDERDEFDKAALAAVPVDPTAPTTTVAAVSDEAFALID